MRSSSLSFFVFFLLIGCCSPCSSRKKVEKRIIKGRNSNPYLFFVKIANKLEDNNITYFGGSLIDHRHILTAASCVINSMELKVYVGDSTRPRETVVRHYRIHEVWSGRTHENDIAVIKFKNSLSKDKVSYLTPCMSSSESSNDKVVTLIGFGVTSKSSSRYSSRLQEISMQEVEEKKRCGKIRSANS
ncbi:trypsin delta-like, partial [Convolutriloba macropyga]|uniref:trypsin delta-like n=1 Tax=Convolutriloba macropyga TaxID=536237 RepID=UPI003F51FF47